MRWRLQSPRTPKRARRPRAKKLGRHLCVAILSCIVGRTSPNTVLRSHHSDAWAGKKRTRSTYMASTGGFVQSCGLVDTLRIHKSKARVAQELADRFGEALGRNIMQARIALCIHLECFCHPVTCG